MTQRRKEEMAGYRRQAIQRETRRRTMQREQLVAKVQSIVSEVEVGSVYLENYQLCPLKCSVISKKINMLF